MKIAVNYADNNFKRAQEFNTKSAYKVGKVDLVLQYGPNDLDDSFKQEFANILSQKRGGGYWLWKPYIILDALSKANDNDYLIYCDSGAFYVNDVNSIIKIMQRDNVSLMTFELPLVEIQWTKKEAFNLMECLDYQYALENQILATYFVVKKEESTVKFFKDYFNYCKNEKIITDVLDNNIQSNYFIEHRHDQSIFSLLCKKRNIKPYRDPSQYGDRPWEYATYDRLMRYKEYTTSNYPRIFMSQRKCKIKNFIIKERIKDFLFKFKLIKYRNLK